MNKNNKENLPASLESQDIFARFEEIDDKIILNELENQVVDTWCYHFVQDGHHIWGLGKVGIDACAKKLGEKGIALREDSIDFKVDPTNPEYVLFTAKVSRHVVSKDGLEAAVESAIGTKRQWIKLRRRGAAEGEKKIVDNKFWFEQGSIKALRNAKSRLIPDDIKTKVITFAKQKGKVREIQPPVAQKRKEADPTDPKQNPFDKSKSPPIREEAVFPDDKKRTNGLFPPETKNVEVVEAEMPTQKEIMELTGLEATLVDKYNFTPDTIIAKLKEMFGEDELTKLTKVQSREGIKYFKGVIEELNLAIEAEATKKK